MLPRKKRIEVAGRFVTTEERQPQAPLTVPRSIVIPLGMPDRVAGELKEWVCGLKEEKEKRWSFYSFFGKHKNGLEWSVQLKEKGTFSLFLGGGRSYLPIICDRNSPEWVMSSNSCTLAATSPSWNASSSNSVVVVVSIVLCCAVLCCVVVTC